MNVDCPRCGSRYEVDPELFGEAPRTVKCSDCGWEWVHLPGGAKSPARPSTPVETSDESPAGDAQADSGSDEAKAAAGDVDAGLSFGDAMAAAQKALAESTKDSDGAAQPKLEGFASAPTPGAPKSATPGPSGEGAGSGSPSPDAAEDFEIELGSDEAEKVAPEPPPPPAPPPRAPRWLVAVSAAAATLVVIAVLLLLGRSFVLETVPGTAGVYRMLGLTVDAIGAGLDIGDVASSREWSDGEEALIVTGHITNATAGPMAVPPLKIALYNDTDEPLQFVTVAAADKVLMAGATTVFRARIAAPQEAAQRIKITFDAAAGS